MDILKLITGNKSLQSGLLKKVRDMFAEKGEKIIILDFTEEEVKVYPINENEIIVSKNVHEYYKNFYNQNK
jgi:hypothetical protein